MFNMAFSEFLWLIIRIEYNLEITNTTANLDGDGTRLAILINGQYPGPTIITGI